MMQRYPRHPAILKVAIGLGFVLLVSLLLLVWSQIQANREQAAVMRETRAQLKKWELSSQELGNTLRDAWSMPLTPLEPASNTISP